MIGELEALVGHLLVVGGRAVSATPPGALVESPPKKAQRGRELDTFFTLVTPAGTVQGQAAFYEEIARMSADLYFRSSGSVTSGLREAITGVNGYLLTYNTTAGDQYQANIICLVLRGREIYLARTGACLSLLRQGDTFTSAPSDPRDEYALNGLPLGYSPSPDVKLAHYEIAPGHTVILSDAGLAAADPEKLMVALGSAEIAAMQDALKRLAAPKTQAMIIHFAIAGTAISLPPKLPKAPLSTPIPTPIPIVTVAEPVFTSAEPAKIDSPPVEAPKPSKQAKPIDASGGLRGVFRAIARALAWLLKGIARVLNGILDRLLPEPADGRAHIPATMAVGLAILIPVVVVFVVVALRLSQVDETNYDSLVNQVQSQANAAAAEPRTNSDRVKTLWLAVLQRVDEAEKLRPGRSDPVLVKIRAQAQGVLDEYAKVTRVAVTPLRNFGSAAKLGAVIVQAGADLYTLDTTQSAIYRDTLTKPDQIGTRGAQPPPIVQLGSAVASYSVKKIVDMIWLDEGGIRNSHALVALDTQGILVTYSPTFAPATSQPLQGAERWKAPIAIRSFQEKLYILDPPANQIWRYLPSGTTYPNPPEEYFGAEYQRKLGNAVDFAIDEKGNIFVAFADGTLKKYNAGAEQVFDLSGLPEGKLRATNAMYMDNNSPLPAIFVTDPTDQSVYEFTLSGTFQGRFKASDENAFQRLSSVFADGSNIYVTSGQVLYYFSGGTLSATPK